MATLVEDIVSLEKEADQLVAKARAEAKEIEKSAIAEAEGYRQKLAVETDQKIAAYQREMEAKHQRLISEAQKELVKTLDAADRIPAETLRAQRDRIIGRFSEL